MLKGGEGSRCFPLSACDGTRDAKSPNLANFCKVQVSADFLACEGGLRHISRLHKSAPADLHVVLYWKESMDVAILYM